MHPEHAQHHEHAQGQHRDAEQHPHAQEHALHHQAHHQAHPQGQGSNLRQQPQPQPAAPSRKPRGRGQKRESRAADVMDGKQQAIVELPTLSSQEASKRHHEEELQVLASNPRAAAPLPRASVVALSQVKLMRVCLCILVGQMQRTLRAKLLKSAPSADRDEREKAQLASESAGTSPAWRNSVACMRVLQWLETGERMEQEERERARMEQEERERAQESSMSIVSSCDPRLSHLVV